MNRVACSILVLCTLLPLAGCFTMTHQVGTGGTHTSDQDERQWWILWGLVPLNDVDSRAMAGGATDYTVKTEWSPIDVILNIFTSFVTVYSQTVTVTK